LAEDCTTSEKEESDRSDDGRGRSFAGGVVRVTPAEGGRVEREDRKRQFVWQHEQSSCSVFDWIDIFTYTKRMRYSYDDYNGSRDAFKGYGLEQIWP
jgi:hypothetical protein